MQRFVLYGLKQSVNFTGVIPLILPSLKFWKTHEFTGIRPYELMPHSLLKGKLKNILVQSVSVVCIRRQSSRMLSLLSITALRAATNRALMVSSSRCGVSHLCSPLNLPLHCQITLRYFEVEFQTLEPKCEPQSPQIIREEKMLFPLY